MFEQAVFLIYLVMYIYFAIVLFVEFRYTHYRALLWMGAVCIMMCLISLLFILLGVAHAKNGLFAGRQAVISFIYLSFLISFSTLILNPRSPRQEYHTRFDVLLLRLPIMPIPPEDDRQRRYAPLVGIALMGVCALVIWHSVFNVGVQPCSPIDVFRQQSGCRGALVQVRSWDEIENVTFSPDGSLLTFIASSDRLQVRQRDGSRLRDLPQIVNVDSVAFSPDGTLVATASPLEGFAIWSVADQRPVTEVRDPSRPIHVAFTPDGTGLFTGSIAGGVRQWSLDGTLLHTFAPGTTEHVDGLAVASDGAYLAAAMSSSNETVVRVWNLANRTVQTAFSGSATYDIAFSPTVPLLAIADSSGASLWDAASGQLVAQFSGWAPSGRVTSAAFSVDGQLIAFATDEGIITVWDVASAQQRRQFNYPSAVESLAFDPQRPILLAGNHDGTIQQWDIRGAGGN